VRAQTAEGLRSPLRYISMILADQFGDGVFSVNNVSLAKPRDIGLAE
jgi:hypothetical protein